MVDDRHVQHADGDDGEGAKKDEHGREQADPAGLQGVGADAIQTDGGTGLEVVAGMDAGGRAPRLKKLTAPPRCWG